MSFLPNIDLLVDKFNQFSQIQSQNQQQMIALLREISQQLEQIKQQLKENYAHRN
jgi:hypothetical protein